MSTSRRGRSLNEAAHKRAAESHNGSAPSGAKPGRRRNLNMAAHKLGYWPVSSTLPRTMVEKPVRGDIRNGK